MFSYNQTPTDLCSGEGNHWDTHKGDSDGGVKIGHQGSQDHQTCQPIRSQCLLYMICLDQ